jgi:hypothetical protein
MKTIVWDSDRDAKEQLSSLCERARDPGYLIVEYSSIKVGPAISWSDLETWTRTRAVTVADVRCSLQPPVLDVALCSDLVYLREGQELILPGPEEPPTQGVLLACSRAGRRALSRGLLIGGTVSVRDAVQLGLAHAVLAADEPLPLPEPHSLAALTAARDLARSGATGKRGLELELATFRLLFASGDPNEGARAFLERREPEFEDK